MSQPRQPSPDERVSKLSEPRRASPEDERAPEKKEPRGESPDERAPKMVEPRTASPDEGDPPRLARVCLGGRLVGIVKVGQRLAPSLELERTRKGMCPAQARPCTAVQERL